MPKDFIFDSNEVSHKSGDRLGENNEIKEGKTSLIVNYLPQSLKEHDFCQLFAKVGALKTCKLMYDRATGYSFGYGFVEYLDPADAAHAIKEYNGYQIEHKRLKVAYSRPNTEETRNTTLYIKNLPDSFDESALESMFGRFGKIVQVRVIRDQNTGYSRGIAFVIMSTKKEAQEAIESLDGEIPPKGTEPLVVKFTDQDSRRKNMLKALGPPAAFVAAAGGKLNKRSLTANRFNPMAPSLLPFSASPALSNQWNQTFNLPANYPALKLQNCLQAVAAAAVANGVGANSNFGFNDSQGILCPNRGGHVIYVYGLRHNTTEQEIYNLFSPYGKILRTDIVIDYKTNLTKGYGFVAMEKYDEACKAVEELNGYYFNGRTLQVRFKS